MFINTDNLIGEVMIGGFDHNDHEVEFKILGDMGAPVSRSATLDFGKENFRLFKGLVRKNL